MISRYYYGNITKLLILNNHAVLGELASEIILLKDVFPDSAIQTVSGAAWNVVPCRPRVIVHANCNRNESAVRGNTRYLELLRYAKPVHIINTSELMNLLWPGRRSILSLLLVWSPGLFLELTTCAISSVPKQRHWLSTKFCALADTRTHAILRC